MGAAAPLLRHCSATRIRGLTLSPLSPAPVCLVPLCALYAARQKAHQHYIETHPNSSLSTGGHGGVTGAVAVAITLGCVVGAALLGFLFFHVMGKKQDEPTAEGAAVLKRNSPVKAALGPTAYSKSGPTSVPTSRVPTSRHDF